MSRYPQRRPSRAVRRQRYYRDRSGVAGFFRWFLGIFGDFD
ncbi:hypothetical protein ACQEU8_35870 [Streptomyces sp. CA-250714]